MKSIIAETLKMKNGIALQTDNNKNNRFQPKNIEMKRKYNLLGITHG